MSKTPTTATLTVAAAQLLARPLEEAATTLAAIESAIARAAQKRVDLLVLPECAYPVYHIESPAAYRASAHLSSAAFTQWLCRQAAAHQLHIVCGLIEEQGETLYNAAILVDQWGKLLGRTRKRFLWNGDHDWFARGEEIRAQDTLIGRIGTIICAEARAPEIAGTLASDRAEILAMPTCWVSPPDHPDRLENPQPEFLIAARAREFGVPFVCANKTGSDGGKSHYVGQSRIVRADGSVAAEAPAAGETVIAARIVRRPASRVWMSAHRRERLLSEQPPVRPPGGAPRRVTLAAMPTAIADERYTGGMGESLFLPLRERGVNLLMVNMSHEGPAEQLAMLANAFDIKAIAFPAQADVLPLGPAHVGCVPCQWATRFPTARALALEGAEILMMFDMPDDLPMMRTRALENRVFVVGANRLAAAIIDPDGRVLAHTRADKPGEAIAAVDLTQAADKLVAPRTDVFDERRPALYHFE